MSLDQIHPDDLYHLASPEEWAAYQAGGFVAPASLETEGFVHCSWGHQVAGTLERHFAGVTGLLAVQVDPMALGAASLAEEDSYGSGETFPHIYGAIPIDAAVAVLTVT